MVNDVREVFINFDLNHVLSTWFSKLKQEKDILDMKKALNFSDLMSPNYRVKLLLIALKV